jgi:hypothetical protein
MPPALGMPAPIYHSPTVPLRALLLLLPADSLTNRTTPVLYAASGIRPSHAIGLRAGGGTKNYQARLKRLRNSSLRLKAP